ncbi:hypothetical protein M404DRAFT_35236 [Pisolithus tinctorius Marx 270]|uniref:Uncharacterized protein n=1 Tax=Pisolithus tinctorius Marx 270 TaxID=870435 RepID=A0A0C3J995_PISTI|nr:hypothetical protein M404DRAFT_35236 [Pisolithus tinctorius Marx 270]
MLKFANPPDVNPTLEHEFACKTTLGFSPSDKPPTLPVCFPAHPLTPELLSLGLLAFTSLLVSSQALVPAFIPLLLTPTLLTTPIPVLPALLVLYLRF